LPRHAGLHNVAYWLNADYHAAGLVPTASVAGQRYVDILGIDDYIANHRRVEFAYPRDDGADGSRHLGPKR
jgi:hypothetical protein